MPKVKIAGDPECPACQSAKKYFDDKKIAYDFYNVYNDTKGKRLANSLKADSIPVIKLCGIKRSKRSKKKSRCETVVGFDPDKFKNWGF